jgi:hypothetical protein
VQQVVEYEHGLWLDDDSTEQERAQYEEAVANVHLMAAAPDLLEALRGVLEGGAHDGECDNLDSEGRHKGACIKHLVTARQRENAARAAIAKAEGK